MSKWKQQGGEILNKLFPEKKKEILLLIVALPILWVLSIKLNPTTEVESLLRPRFQEPKKNVVLEYEYKGEYGFSDSLSVDLGKAKDSSAKIQQKLEKSAVLFQQYFFQDSSFQQIDQPLNLPKTFQEATVRYNYQPANLLMKDGNWNYFELFADKPSQEIIIFVDLEYENEIVSFSQKLEIGSENFSREYIQRLLKQELANQVAILSEEESSELKLPKELKGGSLYWKEFQGRANPSEMAGVFILLILVLSLISRASAREKKRQKEADYLRDFTQMLHHLVLLMKCGKSPYSALVESCQASGRYGEDFQKAREECYQKIYHQEQIALVISTFYQICPLEEIRRFEQLFFMAYERGDQWSINYLEEFRDELFAKRLRKANEQMQRATSKLVFPMALFLIIIVILTIVPAFEQTL